MKRLLIATVFLAAACSPSAFTQAVPSASPAAQSPGASASVAMSPSPKPTPSVLALSEAYLVVADRYNNARERLLNPVTKSWNLADFRYWCAEFARITDEFVAGMAKIPFTTAAMKKDAGALVAETKLEAKAFKRCAVAKSMTTVKKSASTVDRLTPSGTAAAQNLRRDLGIPTR